jgi:hypothetical protein
VLSGPIGPLNFHPPIVADLVGQWLEFRFRVFADLSTPRFRDPFLGVAQLGRARVAHALFDKARLGGASERLAVLVDRFGVAGIGVAFLHEAVHGGARKRFAVLVYRLGGASVLRHRGTEGQARYQDGK